MLLRDVPQHLGAAAVREHEVQQDDVEVGPPHPFPRLGHGRRRGDFVAEVLELVPEHLGQGLIILDDEDT